MISMERMRRILAKHHQEFCAESSKIDSQSFVCYSRGYHKSPSTFLTADKDLSENIVGLNPPDSWTPELRLPKLRIEGLELRYFGRLAIPGMANGAIRRLFRDEAYLSWVDNKKPVKGAIGSRSDHPEAPRANSVDLFAQTPDGVWHRWQQLSQGPAHYGGRVHISVE